MRDIKVIEAEISKLQAELADAKAEQSMRISAVYILKNLGWTFDYKNGGWHKPLPSPVKPTIFDRDTMTHIKAGDWIKYDTGLTGGYGYVRSVHGKYAKFSTVTGATPRGAIVSDRTDTIHVNFMKVVSHAEILKAKTFK
ncbi:hypothetical protein TARRARE_18 [Escherichia phage vB_Ec_Tarrare]|uniref:Uncharacterized protein n=1 Tax=Escherichia phage vB_Ec_Tarrare TaxID=3032379 RepID=A0AAF0ICR1_9CAUD|nr:hypothetical protein TARRARE_18 [Escherichia phage vB_Ec_Tarrare]